MVVVLNVEEGKSREEVMKINQVEVKDFLQAWRSRGISLTFFRHFSGQVGCDPKKRREKKRIFNGQADRKG